MVDRVDVGEYRRVTENGRLLTGDSVLYLPVSLVFHSLVGPLVIGIYVSQWVGHFQGAIPFSQS